MYNRGGEMAVDSWRCFVTLDRAISLLSPTTVVIANVEPAT